MTTSQFARLEEADIRSAWRHEAHDFTPWQLKNLDGLSEAIGVPLEAVGTEIAVDTFAADLIARNMYDDSRVLIENQLEGSDHTHLGQILTYLAGLNAKTIVWIATSFRESHLSAIKWLNDSTDDEYAFFAVRIKVVRIGDSPLAPVFEVLARPNEWERRLQETAQKSEALTERGTRNLMFWTRFVELVPGERDRGGEPRAQSNRWREIPGLDMIISMYLSKGYVGLFIRGTRGADGQEVRERLIPHAEQLSQLLGVSMGTQPSWFFPIHRKGDTDNAGEWDALITWLAQTADHFEQSLIRLLAENP